MSQSEAGGAAPQGGREQDKHSGPRSKKKKKQKKKKKNTAVSAPAPHQSGFALGHMSIEQVPGKGRTLVARRSFHPGDVVFHDTPCIIATWDDTHCIECCVPHDPVGCDRVRQMYPSALLADLTRVEDELSAIQYIDSLDRARALLKLLVRWIHNPQNPACKQALSLTAVNQARCQAAVQRIQGSRVADVLLASLVPGVAADERGKKKKKKKNKNKTKNAVAERESFHDTTDHKEVTSTQDQSGGVTVKQSPEAMWQVLAHFIGVLNTNSIQLQEEDGTALYPVVSLLEHSCSNNCNVATAADHGALVVAVTHVAAGEHLSIDYGDALHPTAQRQAFLKESYDFHCDCPLCTTLPDRCRAFCCAQQVGVAPCPGPVCPVGDGLRPAQWRCLACSASPTELEVATFLSTEQRVIALFRRAAGDVGDEAADDGKATPVVLSVPLIDSVLAQGVLHATHHAVYWCLDALGLEYAMRADDRGKLVDAAAIWRRCADIQQQCLPRHHEDKVQCWDRLAQVECALGNVNASVDAWQHAYEVSCVVNTPEASTSIALRELWQHPPLTVEALRARLAGPKT